MPQSKEKMFCAAEEKMKKATTSYRQVNYALIYSERQETVWTNDHGKTRSMYLGYWAAGLCCLHQENVGNILFWQWRACHHRAWKTQLMIEKRDDLRKSLVSNAFKGNQEQKWDCHPERMSMEEPRSAIPKAVTTSTGRDRPLWGQEGKSPEWWPSDMPFPNPKRDFGDTRKRKSPWIDTSRQILAAYLNWMEGYVLQYEVVM
jgi:hypothetical protein